jgi:hypothetical protein
MTSQAEATVTPIKTRKASPAKAAQPKAASKPAIVITAPRGGSQVVAPKPGKIAAAIKATGKSISQLAREFGQNPSQLRRLSLDQVAKVDLVRAQSIAKALGVKLGDLFDAPQAKAKAAPKAKAGAKPAATRKASTRKPASRASRGARQAKADQATGGK